MSDVDSATIEAEVGTRLEQIRVIVRRRAELLRQMHQIYKRRENIGSGLLLDHTISDADAEASFMSRFDLEQNPITGFASHPNHASVFALPSSSSRVQDNVASSSRTGAAMGDSPMSYSEDEIDLLGRPQQASHTLTSLRSPKSATTTTITLDDDRLVEEELLKDQVSRMNKDAMVVDESSQKLPLSSNNTLNTIQITFPPSQTRPPIIHAPNSPLKSIDPIDPSLLSTKLDADVPPSLTVDPKQLQLTYKPEYTLPPLKMLPAEFRRNAKPAKLQRKKEKEREKGEIGKKDNKDDWVPAGIAKIDVSMRVNTVSKRIRYSMKCVNTREWEIAMAEIKLMRTLDRIESLKDASRWSFRQPKKQQRGSAMTTKTHWDYLMDEMKWMRTDFREERKWKMALAFDISTAVLLWHEAGTAEERIRQGICVLWKGSRDIVDEVQDTQMSAVEPEESTELGDSAKMSFALPEDDEDDEDEDDQDDQPRAPGEASESAITIEDYLPSQVGTPGIGMKDLEPKKEEADDNVPAFLDTPTAPPHSQLDTPAPTGLKAGSTDPTLPKPVTLQPDVLPTDTAITRKGRSSKLSTYAPLRDKLVYSDLDKFFITPEDLQFQPLNGEDAPPSSIDLNAIFADLQIVGISEPPPSAEETSLIAKKKSGKSEGDAHKRIDEVAQAKVYPASEFMYTKPVLLGALEPYKHWKDGAWTGWDDGPVSVDVNGYTAKPASECFSELFDYSKPPINFPRLISKWEKSREKANEQDGEFMVPVLRHLWTSADDTLLKTIADRHPDNWKLIAESFNSSRFTIGTDKRTDADCYERWKEVFAQPMLKGMADAPENPTPPSTPAPMTSPTMTTRGIKRSHQASISISTGPLATASEPKKRRRHQLIHDSMRKTAKKKADAIQKAALGRKSTVVHDTHAQYNKLPRLSPGELSRVKTEKDMKEAQERMMRMQQQQRMNAASIPQINGQPTAQQVAIQRTPSNGAPIPVNPQLRASQVNISQQQARMSPQNGVPAVNGSRIASQQQLMQARQQLNQPLLTQQQQQLAQAIAQVQAQTQTQTTNGNNVNGAANMSPPPTFSVAGVPRDASSSPAQNSVGTPSVTPRPPSAQAIQPTNGAAPIPASSQRAYYMPNVNMSNYSAEQMAQLRNIQLSMLQQQQQQQQQQASNSAIPHQNGGYTQPPPT